MLEAEITDLFVMILNGILIRKICGFTNTDGSYIIAKGEKHFSLESKLTRSKVSFMHFYLSFIGMLYSVTVRLCSVNS